MFNYFRYFKYLYIFSKNLDNFKISYTFWIFFWILTLKFANIFNYKSLIQIYLDICNILVRIGWFFRYSNFHSKQIFNPFHWYYFFGLDSVFRIFCRALDVLAFSHSLCVTTIMSKYKINKRSKIHKEAKLKTWMF